MNWKLVDGQLRDNEVLDSGYLTQGQALESASHIAPNYVWEIRLLNIQESNKNTPTQRWCIVIIE